MAKPTFDAAEARRLGQTVAVIYDEAAARFGLQPRDIAFAAIGAAVGAAMRANMSQADMLETVRQYWPKVRGSARD